MTDFVFFLLLPSHFALVFCPHFKLLLVSWCETCFKKFEFYPDLFLPYIDDIPFIFLNIVLASLSVSFMCSFRLGIPSLFSIIPILYKYHVASYFINLSFLYLFFYLFMFLSSSSYCQTFCLFQPILYFFLCFHFSAVSDHVHITLLAFWYYSFGYYS